LSSVRTAVDLLLEELVLDVLEAGQVEAVDELAVNRLLQLVVRVLRTDLGTRRSARQRLPAVQDVG
jgi:hypothetical protein